MSLIAMSKRVLASFTVVVLAGVITGCYADPGDAEPSIGNVVRTETITAANLAFVSDGEGRATLVGTLFNEGQEADRLVDVDVETDGGPVEVELLRGPVDLPLEEPVRLADDPAVLVSSDDLRQGFRARLELTFERSSPISTTATVESRTGPYADVEIPGSG